MCERRFHPDRSDNFCTVNTELRVNTELLVSLGGVLSSAGQTGRHVLAALETRGQTLTPEQVNSSLQGPNSSACPRQAEQVSSGGYIYGVDSKPNSM